mmetsp:Transcript_34347/g.81406  ORF Transcript_34347/g.81406 Transcript_34347/m.81406 type:complete len:200 (+) Transcript_34347:648-1247(+)
MRRAPQEDRREPDGAPPRGRDERRCVADCDGAAGDNPHHGHDGLRPQGGDPRGRALVAAVRRLEGALQGQRRQRHALGAAEGPRLLRLRGLQETRRVSEGRGRRALLPAGAPRREGRRSARLWRDPPRGGARGCRLQHHPLPARGPPVPHHVRRHRSLPRGPRCLPQGRQQGGPAGTLRRRGAEHCRDRARGRDHLRHV